MRLLRRITSRRITVCYILDFFSRMMTGRAGPVSVGVSADMPLSRGSVFLSNAGGGSSNGMRLLRRKDVLRIDELRMVRPETGMQIRKRHW